MMGWKKQLRLKFALVGLCLVGVASTATAQTTNCGATVLSPANHSVSVSPQPNIASYNPFTGMATQSVTITVARNGNGVNNPCRLGVYIEGGLTTKTLANGANSLTYDMRVSSTSVLFPTGATVTNVVVLTMARNQSGSFTLTYEVPASQLVAAGLYQDLNAEVVVANVTTAGQINNAPALRRRVSMPIQATVVKACQLGTPTAPTLAFAATDIPNGLPNEGTTKSTQMTANCTAPTRVRLTGQALQPVIATGARPNFDNFINYRAVGTFGAASATLTTTPSAQNVDSAGYNGAANASVSGTVNVDVNLKKAQPIIAGNYSGVLTVTLDPNL